MWRIAVCCPGSRGRSDARICRPTIIRPAAFDDVHVLVSGRDAECTRFLGDGSPAPRPAACIVVDDKVVGWADYDHGRSLLSARARFTHRKFAGCRSTAVGAWGSFATDGDR
jgi:hypothetical protein